MIFELFSQIIISVLLLSFSFILFFRNRGEKRNTIKFLTLLSMIMWITETIFSIMADIGSFHPVPLHSAASFILSASAIILSIGFPLTLKFGNKKKIVKKNVNSVLTIFFFNTSLLLSLTFLIPKEMNEYALMFPLLTSTGNIQYDVISLSLILMYSIFIFVLVSKKQILFKIASAFLALSRFFSLMEHVLEEKPLIYLINNSRLVLLIISLLFLILGFFYQDKKKNKDYPYSFLTNLSV